MNLDYPPAILKLKASSTFFKLRPKCGKQHLMKENSHYLTEIIELARFARCQRAQKPRIKNPKMLNRALCQCQPATQFLLSSVELKCNFLHKERELVLSPYKAHTAKILLKYFY